MWFYTAVDSHVHNPPSYPQAVHMLWNVVPVTRDSDRLAQASGPEDTYAAGARADPHSVGSLGPQTRRTSHVFDTETCDVRPVCSACAKRRRVCASGLGGVGRCSAQPDAGATWPKTTERTKKSPKRRTPVKTARTPPSRSAACSNHRTPGRSARRRSSRRSRGRRGRRTSGSW